MGGAPASGDGDWSTELAEHARTAATIVADRDYEGQLVLGYAHATLKDYDRASQHFESAAEEPSFRLDAGIQLSLCQDQLEQPKRARRTLENLRREYPDDANLANTLGYWLAERGEDLDYAEKLIRQALDEEPDNGAYLDSLGWVYFKRERYDEAFDLLVQAVNARPNDPVVLEHLGIVLHANGQYEQALDVLRRSLAAGGDPETIQPLIDELAAKE
jgi:Flp pilus assembly protein TadD